MNTHKEDVYGECRSAQAAGEEISDACAKAIGRWYQSPGRPNTVSFVSYGAIAEGLWREFTDNGALYEAGDPDEKLALDMLGTYLINREDKGPVEGW